MLYKEFKNPLNPKFPRMFVCKNPGLNTGMSDKNDIVTIRASNDVNFYILVEETSADYVEGEIIGIGSEAKDEFENWHHGDKIKVAETAIVAIIRAD